MNYSTGDPFRRVRQGDPLQIPAQVYNRFLDMSRSFTRRDQVGANALAGVDRNTGVITVQNSSGADVDAFNVLGIDSPVILPSDALDEFQNDPALSCITPAYPTHAGKFVVCLGPIADGDLGLAVVSGVTPAMLSVTSDTDTLAEITDGDPTQLTTGANGTAQIFWKDSGTGGGIWGIVRLSLGPPRLCYAKLTADWAYPQNTLSSTPCNTDGSTLPGASSLTLNLLMPGGADTMTDAAVQFCELVTGNVVEYIPHAPGLAADGQIIGWRQFPKCDSAGMVLQGQGVPGDTPTGLYFDWARAH